MEVDAILAVNAGSSSVRFQIFDLAASGDPRRLLKGQMDGIGTQPRLRAETSDGSPLIEKSYTPRARDTYHDSEPLPPGQL